MKWQSNRSQLRCVLNAVYFMALLQCSFLQILLFLTWSAMNIAENKIEIQRVECRYSCARVTIVASRNAFATRKINKKINLSWAHKQFTTRVIILYIYASNALLNNHFVDNVTMWLFLTISIDFGAGIFVTAVGQQKYFNLIMRL